MKQEERARQSRKKILSAALEAFAAHSYDVAQLNQAFAKHHLSKGLVYHYFESKEDLYLNCLQNCCDELLACYHEADQSDSDGVENIRRLLCARQQFYRENPLVMAMLLQSTYYASDAMQEQVRRIRRELDEFEYRKCCEMIDCVPLRDGITKEKARQYFFLFQKMFHGYYKTLLIQNDDFQDLLAHDAKVLEILDVFLNGIQKHGEGSRTV